MYDFLQCLAKESSGLKVKGSTSLFSPQKWYKNYTNKLFW